MSMMVRMARFAGVGLVALTLLAGCVAPEGDMTKPAAQQRPIPEDVYSELRDMALAKKIAQACPAYAFSTMKQDSYFHDVEADLYKRGYKAHEMERWARNLDQARLQKDIFAYIEKRNIVITQRQTFCAAGAQELSEGTRVAYYLRPIRGVKG
jgi:hypothetical protein